MKLTILLALFVLVPLAPAGDGRYLEVKDIVQAMTPKGADVRIRFQGEDGVFWLQHDQPRFPAMRRALAASQRLGTPITVQADPKTLAIQHIPAIERK